MKTPLEVRSFDQNLDTLLERFPIFSLVAFELDSNIEPAKSARSPRLRCNDVSLLYVLGLDPFIYEKAFPWLEEQPSRHIVFLENNPLRMSQALHTHTDLFENRQVHIDWLGLSDPMQKAEALAEKYSVSNFSLHVHPDFTMKSLAKFKKRLTELSLMHEAMLSEIVFSEKLFENFYQNLPHIFDSFPVTALQGKFENIPAIICGAGPSLEKSIPLLKKLEDKALLITGGSAITALSQKNVSMHLAVACDPMPGELERIQRSAAFEVPFLYSTRVHKGVFSQLNGPFGWVHNQSAGMFEVWLNKICDLQKFEVVRDTSSLAMSVSSMNLALAHLMGCNPIIFCGMDLSYQNGKKYPDGVLKKGNSAANEGARKKAKNIYDETVETNALWQIESHVFSAFAKKHPETTFLNATEGGLGFSGVKNLSLQEVHKTHLTDMHDLWGMIRASYASETLEPIKKPVQMKMTELKSSLLLCLEKVQILRKESSAMTSLKKPTGAYVCAQIELEEEKIYREFFLLFRHQLEKFFAYHEKTQKPFSPLEKEEKTWALLEANIQNYLKLYS